MLRCIFCYFYSYFFSNNSLWSLPQFSRKCKRNENGNRDILVIFESRSGYFEKHIYFLHSNFMWQLLHTTTWYQILNNSLLQRVSLDSWILLLFINISFLLTLQCPQLKIVHRKRSHSVSSSSGSEISIDLTKNDKHHHKKSSRVRKMDEVERLAEMERQRRQREAEQRLIEEETAKRIEELVNKKVAEELEKRKDEIELEVAKRVEEAKKILEKQMMEEMERRREKQLQEEKLREVRASGGLLLTSCNCKLIMCLFI